MNPFLTVCIVSRGREELLEKCLRSVIEALPEWAEVLLLMNGEEAPLWLKRLPCERIRVSHLVEMSRALARNRGMGLARGEIVYFLDDDVVVPEGLFERVAEKMCAYPEISIVGGPNLTPEDSPFLEKLFGAILTSPFAAPNVRVRYFKRGTKDREATERELILCNLALWKRGLPEQILFRDLSSNEENCLLYECQRAGLKALYSPEVYVYHRRRRNILSWIKQIMSYGRGRAEQTVVFPKSLYGSFLVPSLALLSLPFLMVGSPKMAAGLILLHSALSFMSALFSAELRRLGLKGLGMSIPLTALLHASYGIGMLSGFFVVLATRISFLEKGYPLPYRASLGDRSSRNHRMG